MKRVFIFLLLLSALGLGSGPIQAATGVQFPKTEVQLNQPDEEAGILTAENLTYDDKLQIINASGRVEFTLEPYVLMADSLSFDQIANVVTASGNVYLVKQSGEVVSSNYLELTGDLKNGVIQKLGILFTDQSRMAAQQAARQDSNTMMLDKVTYSPCDLCRANPTRAPVWQIKARQVEHNEAEKQLTYRDAVMEMGGVPVFYMPYFSHPDPSVKQRSGFLPPSVLNNDTLGTLVRNYYYWGISPDKDATIEASYATASGPLVGGEWRQHVGKGEYKLSGSVTQSDLVTATGTKSDKTRGHIFGEGEYHFDRFWRGKAELALASDPNYLRTYKYGDRDILRNSLQLERFGARNYININNYAFQDTRPTRIGDQPNLLPRANFDFVGAPGSTAGGRLRAEGDILSIARPGSAQNVQRLSAALGWEKQIITNNGLVNTLSTAVRSNSYLVQNANTGTDNDYSQSRAYPEFQWITRYPMARSLESSRLMIEPVLALTSTPGVRNSGIPNEDSQGIELDATNLFSVNRYPGLDRVEGGSRATYGGRFVHDDDNGFYTSVFVGQNYNLTQNNFLPSESGLDDRVSDYVGQINLVPNRYIDVNYKFRLDKDNLESERQELTSTIGPPIMRLSTSYLQGNQFNASGTQETREQLSNTLSTRLTNQWNLNVFDTRNLGQFSSALSSGATLQYLDECFSLLFTAQRDYTKRIGIDSGDTFYVQLSFKNLGSINTPQLGTNLLSGNTNTLP